MTRTLILAATAGIAALVLTGCGMDPTRIDPSGNQTLTTTHELNVKDFQIAAEQCISSLLRSGVLVRPDGRRTIIMINRVKNKTTRHIDTQIITNKIRQAVLRSGKAATTTAVSGRGPEDTATRDVRDLEDSDLFDRRTLKKRGTVIAPDMSLAGEIIQKRSRVGRTQESYFFIHMTLTDLNSGLALWEDNVEVAKQETRPLIGL